MTKICSKCKIQRSLTDFYKNGKYKHSECKECKRLREKVRYAQNPQKIYARTQAYIKNNPEKQRQWQRDYTKRQRAKVLEYYGKSCACCKENNVEFLAIDHINGGGTKHLKELGIRGGSFYLWLIKNNFPPEFRTLCHNCNTSLGHYNYCPHQNKFL